MNTLLLIYLTLFVLNIISFAIINVHVKVALKS